MLVEFHQKRGYAIYAGIDRVDLLASYLTPEQTKALLDAPEKSCAAIMAAARRAHLLHVRDTAGIKP